MSKFSNYLETELINHVLRNATYTSPTTVYVALHSADPTDDGSGAELAVANNYARIAMAFDAPSNGVTQNTALVTFTATGGDWLSATHFAVWDASVAGNMLFYGALDTARLATDGDSLKFTAGTLTVTLQ